MVLPIDETTANDIVYNCGSKCGKYKTTKVELKGRSIEAWFRDTETDKLYTIYGDNYDENDFEAPPTLTMNFDTDTSEVFEPHKHFDICGDLLQHFSPFDGKECGESYNVIFDNNGNVYDSVKNQMVIFADKHKVLYDSDISDFIHAWNIPYFSKMNYNSISYWR